MKLAHLAAAGLAPLLVSSCSPGVPGAHGQRPSGQSGLMGQTYAGKNACNPANHLRPFILEWDATDLSSFESLAARDVVVVKYEGCTLTVLEACRNESVSGSLGAYLPVEWTSGSLEKLEIADEGELHAKLPLGAATLGGRVSAGERFRMEYYVAGTRTASRPAVYRGDLDRVPGCAGATHFVHAYNLGAFALGSASEVEGSAEGSVYGFGAGASRKTSVHADKQGGELSKCKAESATEVEGCKVPIRLTLRPIANGENPERAQLETPDTPESTAAAALVDRKVEMTAEARAHWDAAIQKQAAKDGKACLQELDAHDRLDPTHQSTNPRGGMGYLRAQCLMLAGQCDAGKELARKVAEGAGGFEGPERVEKFVDALVMMYCQGKMSDRDTILRALKDLQDGAYMAKKPVAFCQAAYATVQRLRGKVKPKDEDDAQIVNLDRNLYQLAASCFGRAEDCATAYRVYEEGYPLINADKLDAATKQKIIRGAFESSVPKCKGK
ncbi:MAG: hypothetical protein IT376_05935 [Polyangiaceae bacterium]|nr:hypothetical protein [Polyangiaceae bacterium]